VQFPLGVHKNAHFNVHLAKKWMAAAVVFIASYRLLQVVIMNWFHDGSLCMADAHCSGL